MDERTFDPHVRFVNRRCLVKSYSCRVYAFDYRLFYVERGTLDVEFEDGVVRLESSDLLTVPPGVGYRLVLHDASVVFFIVNFDFDRTRADEPARSPVSENFFDSSEIFSKYCISPFEEVLHLPKAFELEDVVKAINTAEDIYLETACHVRSGLMKYLLCRVAHLCAKREKGVGDDRIRAIKAYVERYFAQPINNRTVAMKMGYHPHYLNACFTQSEGMTLHAYIESVRLRHAKELLTMTQMPISEIARACGFLEASYFVKFFSRHIGMTPKRYRGLSM